MPGADPGFFLGGGALVSCSTSTPKNHIVFFGRIPVVLENRWSSQGSGGGGVRTRCTLPLDSPLYAYICTWMGRHLRERVLWGIIMWPAMGKTKHKS